MAKKDSHVIIAYYPGADKADMAADQIKAWDKATDSIKLGGMGILTWQEGKIHTRKVGTRGTKTGSKWGLALGAATGILSGGVTLIGGALVGAAGGAIAGALFHKNLGLSDDDKARLEQHLQSGGAALVVMADEDEVEPTQAELASLKMGVKVEDYKVPEETMSQVEEADDVKPVDEADDGS
jgi:uncharacterized membrane protein